MKKKKKKPQGKPRAAAAPGMSRANFTELAEVTHRMMVARRKKGRDEPASLPGVPPGWRIIWQWTVAKRGIGESAIGRVTLCGPNGESQLLWSNGPGGNRPSGPGWMAREAEWTLGAAKREYERLQRAALRRRQHEAEERRYG